MKKFLNLSLIVLFALCFISCDLFGDNAAEVKKGTISLDLGNIISKGLGSENAETSYYTVTIFSNTTTVTNNERVGVGIDYSKEVLPDTYTVNVYAYNSFDCVIGFGTSTLSVGAGETKTCKIKVAEVTNVNGKLKVSINVSRGYEIQLNIYKPDDSLLETVDLSEMENENALSEYTAEVSLAPGYYYFTVSIKDGVQLGGITTMRSVANSTVSAQLGSYIISTQGGIEIVDEIQKTAKITLVLESTELMEYSTLRAEATVENISGTLLYAWYIDKKFVSTMTNSSFNFDLTNEEYTEGSHTLQVVVTNNVDTVWDAEVTFYIEKSLVAYVYPYGGKISEEAMGYSEGYIGLTSRKLTDEKQITDYLNKNTETKITTLVFNGFSSIETKFTDPIFSNVTKIIFEGTAIPNICEKAFYDFHKLREVEFVGEGFEKVNMGPECFGPYDKEDLLIVVPDRTFIRDNEQPKSAPDAGNYFYWIHGDLYALSNSSLFKVFYHDGKIVNADKSVRTSTNWKYSGKDDLTWNYVRFKDGYFKFNLPNNCTKDGYTFCGWYTTDTGFTDDNRTSDTAKLTEGYLSDQCLYMTDTDVFREYYCVNTSNEIHLFARWIPNTIVMGPTTPARDNITLNYTSCCNVKGFDASANITINTSQTEIPGFATYSSVVVYADEDDNWVYVDPNYSDNDGLAKTKKSAVSGKFASKKYVITGFFDEDGRIVITNDGSLSGETQNLSKYLAPDGSGWVHQGKNVSGKSDPFMQGNVTLYAFWMETTLLL